MLRSPQQRIEIHRYAWISPRANERVERIPRLDGVMFIIHKTHYQPFTPSAGPQKLQTDQYVRRRQTGCQAPTAVVSGGARRRMGRARGTTLLGDAQTQVTQDLLDHRGVLAHRQQP